MPNRVLVVEDNELNLKLFCDLLRAHGFATQPVRDGREAVATARQFEPHLVIMDIQLPHVTGFELIQQMQRDTALRQIPIMAVTAYSGHEDEERIRSAGAKAYVAKPISLMRFMEQVRALLPAEPVATMDDAQGEAAEEAPSSPESDTPDGAAEA